MPKPVRVERESGSSGVLELPVQDPLQNPAGPARTADPPREGHHHQAVRVSGPLIRSASKRVLDVVLSLVLLVLALPIMAVAAALVRCSSSGAAIYRQIRMGQGGRPFVIFKLRTMVDGAEKATGPVWSAGVGRDQRITPLGSFLRDTHIDELPQLFNVLMGQMSLVGPRPERPEFVEPLLGQLPGYDQRLRVLPGVTGLAQVKLPPDSSLESVRLKLVYDLYYVTHQGLATDLKLIFLTAWKVVDAVVRRLARLPSNEAIEGDPTVNSLMRGDSPGNHL
jgi:lipopolysaccharide/colanic/teichoic acid biosynthesis glycosyltransferase